MKRTTALAISMLFLCSTSAPSGQATQPDKEVATEVNEGPFNGCYAQGIFQGTFLARFQDDGASRGTLNGSRNVNVHEPVHGEAGDFIRAANIASERARRAFLASIGVRVGPSIISGCLPVPHAKTRESLYLAIGRGLPNWSVSNSPRFVVSELMTVQRNPFLSVMRGDLRLAAAIIAGSSTVSMLVAATRLVTSEVTRRVEEDGCRRNG